MGKVLCGRRLRDLSFLYISKNFENPEAVITRAILLLLFYSFNVHAGLWNELKKVPVVSVITETINAMKKDKKGGKERKTSIRECA